MIIAQPDRTFGPCELGVNLPGHRNKILMRTARLRKKFKLEEDDQARSVVVYSTEREQGLSI